jgi:hypothetical protein
MPNSPAKKKGSSPGKRTRADVIRSLIRKGWSGNEIACKLAPNDARKRKVIRGQVARVVADDEEFQTALMSESRGILVEGLPVATDALVKRAARGRPDAIKLLYEASGFHNPKVKHEHSGDIKIEFANIPRPPRQENETAREAALALEDGSIVDADVVEE